MIIKITIDLLEGDAGPFDIYSNSTGTFLLVASAVDKALLVAGYSLTMPNGTTITRVQSAGECTNYEDITVILVPQPSPYSITSSCIGSSITNDYTLVGVPTGATVVVKAAFSGYLERSPSYQANATVTVNGVSQTSQCIEAGDFYIEATSSFASNGVVSISAVANNYAIENGVSLTVELVSVNGVNVGSTIAGCWGNSGGAAGCPT